MPAYEKRRRPEDTALMRVEPRPRAAALTSQRLAFVAVGLRADAQLAKDRGAGARGGSEPARARREQRS